MGSPKGPRQNKKKLTNWSIYLDPSNEHNQHQQCHRKQLQRHEQGGLWRKMAGSSGKICNLCWAWVQSKFYCFSKPNLTIVQDYWSTALTGPIINLQLPPGQFPCLAWLLKYVYFPLSRSFTMSTWLASSSPLSRLVSVMSRSWLKQV